MYSIRCSHLPQTLLIQPKKQAKASKRICNKAAKSESTDDVGAWPPERPRDMQLQLMKQSFSDFSYLSNLFSAESEYKSVRKLLLYNYPHKANIIIAFKLGSP